MPHTRLKNLTIERFHEGVRKKKFTVLETVQAFYSHIRAADKKIGAYLTLNEEEALRRAEEIDRRAAQGETLGPLSGVPFAIKDNILLKGMRATAASRILEHHTASYDAGVITKLREADSIFLGKTNLDEFAMGSSTENSAFQITRNPHDPKRVPGGSSGGSAAAVAADLALAALGSDTGGSIRQPAALCGAVGLKPTYGAVSRSGLIALASSLDQIGPITKTVRDAEIVFHAIRGQDPLDATSSPPRFAPKPDLQEIKNFTVGIPKEYFGNGISKEVGGAVQGVIDVLKSQGVKFQEISLPHTKYALSCYYIILPAEASSNLARFDGVRYSRIQSPNAEHQPTSLKEIYLKQRGLGFGSEVKRRIILGTFVLSSGYYDAYYKKAQQARALIAEDFRNAFKNVRVILTPVSPTPAFELGEKTSDPLSMYLSDIYTIPINLAGLPGISIPVRERQEENVAHDKKEKHLPIGFQLVGRHFAEGDILGLGEYYEKLHE